MQADLYNVAQSTVSKVVAKVSEVIAEALHQYIRFPQDLDSVQRKFYEIAGFPRVIGCIDCTHVYIQCPDFQRGEIYRNCKGRFSMSPNS